MSQALLNQLDLSKNEIQDGLPVLKPGVYMTTAGEPEITNNSGKVVMKIAFADDLGQGQITQYFNLKNPNDDAQRIGRDQLKTFLTFGGHADPDHPGNAPLKGLPAKVTVEKDGTYQDKNGVTRDSFKIKRFLRLDSPVPLGVAPDTGSSSSRSPSGGGASTAKKANTFDDDIPF